MKRLIEYIGSPQSVRNIRTVAVLMASCGAIMVALWMRAKLHE